MYHNAAKILVSQSSSLSEDLLREITEQALLRQNDLLFLALASSTYLPGPLVNMLLRTGQQLVKDTLMVNPHLDTPTRLTLLEEQLENLPSQVRTELLTSMLTRPKSGLS